LQSVACLSLALLACAHPPQVPESWIWPGANSRNTLEFSGIGRHPAERFTYAKAWDAERFEVAATDPVPCAARYSHRPLTIDIDADGDLEIVLDELSQAPATVLDQHGVPVQPDRRARIDWSAVTSESVRLVADAGWARIPPQLLSADEQGSMIQCLVLNGRPVALAVRLEPAASYYARVLECYDLATGRQDWQYVFGARADLMAAADLDGDGRQDLLLATYGEENGVRANGTTDTDSTYCVSLRDDGSLLWRRGFGPHAFSGSIACVADVNSDRRPEVVVAGYTWQNDFGRLAVLDGATGQVLADTPGRSGKPESHVSLGCADIDADGRVEIVTTTSGRQSEVQVLRLEASGFVDVAARPMGSTGEEGTSCNVRLCGIADLDGDGRTELVTARWRRRQLCADPFYYPSKVDSCGIVILDGTLRTRQDIPLAQRCQWLTLGDVIPGGNVEMLVLTDRLTLYSMD
jgi:hypothetical protein